MPDPRALPRHARTRRSRFILAVVVASGCGSGPLERAAPAHPASASNLAAPGAGATAWDRLKRVLPGSWTMPTKNGPFTVTYRLVSGDSALVETWGAGGARETLTVFHPDQGDLLLTHYCAQGNQPRLRVVHVTEDAVLFRFVDATNQRPDRSMLVERTLRVAGDAFDDTEIYRGPDGALESTTNHFRRDAAHAIAR